MADKNRAKPSTGPRVKPTPQGVLLDKEELDRLDQAAAELGVSRHELMKYAIRQFLNNWERGERPEIASKGIKLIPK